MKIEVSVGELVDKVSILEIKLEHIRDPAKKANVQKEYDLLKKYMEAAGIDRESGAFQDLKRVNQVLWDIEDRIRVHERDARFDDAFIQLARSVYRENDKRAALKKSINLAHGSELIEEKEYVEYESPQ